MVNRQRGSCSANVEQRSLHTANSRARTKGHCPHVGSDSGRTGFLPVPTPGTVKATGTLCAPDHYPPPRPQLRYGNERWAVNHVLARITRRAGAPPSRKNSIFLDFPIFSKNRQHFKPLKKFASDKTFPQHCHFSVLLTIFEASIHYKKWLL